MANWLTLTSVLMVDTNSFACILMLISPRNRSSSRNRILNRINSKVANPVSNIQNKKRSKSAGIRFHDRLRLGKQPVLRDLFAASQGRREMASARW